MEAETPRRLLWQSCYNVRDLGGHRTSGGVETRWRSLVRADNLSRLKSSGWERLLIYGIRTIIDLRSPREVTQELSPFVRDASASGVDYLNVPVLTDVQYDAQPDEAPIDLQYQWFLSNLRSEMAAVITTVAQAPGAGLLFYCHSGKDRSGLVTALLLSLVDVSREDIAADYALSAGYLQPIQDEWMRTGPGPRTAREVAAKRFTSDRATMVTTLRWLDLEYGGPEEYLRGAGVTNEDISRLRLRLLPPGTP